VKKLEARRPQLELYERYYDGDHRLLFQTSKFRESFGDLFGAFADNWCMPVVDAKAERLRVEGFRYGTDPDADTEARAIWQANGLDAESAIAIEEALKLGISYFMVEPPRRRSSAPPKITVESPLEVYVEHAPGNRRERTAAVKVWPDEQAGMVFANVYGPELVWKFQRKAPPTTDVASGLRKPAKSLWMPARATEQLHRWELREDKPTPNPLGVLPFVPMANRRKLLGGGRSELVPVIPLNDLINKVLADAIVGSEFAAYPQRWATGVDPQTDADGNELPVDQYVASISRLWEGPEGAQFGAFPSVDLSNYVKLVELAVVHVAALTRTPPDYMLAAMVNVAGNALTGAERGLVSACRRFQLFCGEDLEDTSRLGFLAIGDVKRGREVRAETIWADPETRTEGERVDALTKLKSLGVPRKALWSRIPGVTQEDLVRWEQWAKEEEAAGLLNAFGALDQPNLELPPGAGR
jgi:hypothetical protein